MAVLFYEETWLAVSSTVLFCAVNTLNSEVFKINNTLVLLQPDVAPFYIVSNPFPLMDLLAVIFVLVLASASTSQSYFLVNTILAQQ